MDRQPVLEGALVTLRPTVPRGLGGDVRRRRRPGIWALHPFRDRWQEPVFRRYFEDALASGAG
ncbi:MAG: hypothetical protein WDN24_21325 [Sphingomonas sp.]